MQQARRRAPQTVFIVDDDEAVRDSLRTLLEAAGYQVRSFGTGGEFLSAIPSEEGCSIIDVRMPGIGGLDVQERLKADGIALPVIVITGHGDVPLAVRAMKGAQSTLSRDRLPRRRSAPRSSASSKLAGNNTRPGMKWRGQRRAFLRSPSASMRSCACSSRVSRTK